MIDAICGSNSDQACLILFSIYDIQASIPFSAIHRH